MTRWNVASFVAGIVFAIGLSIAGMTDPAKVLAFLDVTGEWDPSLALVMGAAILVYAPAYRIITRRAHPLFTAGWRLPRVRNVDGRLILGAVSFGVGWGLVGLCPGPALVSMVTLRGPTMIFALSMLTGMLIFEASRSRKARR